MKKVQIVSAAEVQVGKILATLFQSGQDKGKWVAKLQLKYSIESKAVNLRPSWP